MTAISDFLLDRQIQRSDPTTPDTQRLPAITRAWFSLFRFRSPLLTESRLLSLPVGNEMFHFPTFPPHALCVQAWVTGHDSCRVSPFGNPRIKARLAAPQGLSQPPTSFIGSWCQGIHRAPLLTWPQRCSRPLCSSQGTGGTEPQVRRARGRVRRGLRRRAGPSRADASRQSQEARRPRRVVPGLRAGYYTRSLRTQQRAEAPLSLSSTVPTGKPAVLGVETNERANWSVIHPRAPPPGHTPGAWVWTGSPCGGRPGAP